MSHTTPEIHLCIQQPGAYVHSLGLLDQARYLRYQFRRLGAEVSMAKNRLRHGAINFIFGAHLGFEPTLLDRHVCVFVNLEQLGEGGAQVSPEYLQLLANWPVVDYDAANCSAYRAQPDAVPVFPLLHAPYLKPAESIPLEQRPIDLLFIGSMNERRRAWLDRIEALGLSVALFDGPLYGPERDEFIRQAKAVLNVHFYESSRFEQTRAAICLSLGTPVISERVPGTEVHPAFEDSVVWLEGGQLEQFFSEDFGTPAFFDFARLALARFEQADPAVAYAEMLAFAANHAVERLPALSQEPWRPQRMHVGAGADYKAGWLNISRDAEQEPDLRLDLSRPLDLPLREQSEAHGPIELQAESLELIDVSGLQHEAAALKTLLNQALRLLQTGGELQLDLAGALPPEPAAGTGWLAAPDLFSSVWQACGEDFWALGWFEQRFELLAHAYFDAQARPCEAEAALGTRVVLRKIESSLRERTTARARQSRLRLPDDAVDAAHRLLPASPAAQAGAQKKFKWSILVPSLPARRELRKRMLAILEPQVARYPDVELLVLEDNRSREYGPKLQAMIDIAQGEYLNFVDDDDEISEHYVDTIYPLLNGVDCVGFSARISVEGGPFKSVFYSMKNKVWVDAPEGYYRNPQHLTPIRSELVRQIPWVGHYGADRTWSHKMSASGLLQTENVTDAVLYTYYATQKENREGVWR